MIALNTMRRRAAFIRLALAAALLLLLSQPALSYKPNSPYYGAGRRIAMSSIRTLTFYADRRTAYRRTSPLPQLTCVGSPCSRYQPDVVQCQSMGDGQWKCSADLPSTMRMGRVEVSCEGYDYAEDPYVLKDSCALTYHLLPSGRGPDDPWRSDARRTRWGEWVAAAAFQVVFWGVLGLILVSFVRAIRGGGGTARAVGGGGGGGWGGGGGGGGWWPGASYPPNPPPPYTPKPEPDSTPSWRPGFWTGLGLGGLAATAAATSRRRHPNSGAFYPAPQHSFFNDPVPDYGFGRAGRRTWDDDDRGIGSSSWRESTGFGGTRNR